MLVALKMRKSPATNRRMQGTGKSKETDSPLE
jgi:hypothetical protein